MAPLVRSVFVLTRRALDDRTPIELVKCKMQVQMLVSAPAALPSAPGAASVRSLPGPLAIIAHTFRTTGLRGFWLGHTGTLIRETGGSAAWFSTKEFVASLLLARHPQPYSPSSSTDAYDTQAATRPRDLASWESALSGACAGASYNLALFPADTVKSTMQTEAELRTRLSGGCQRQANPDPAFMWNFAQVDTTVVVI